MKNMNPIFTLKNFRSFGEEGADFELAPITVLTGCNSAGKSSLVKALMLLSETTGLLTNSTSNVKLSDNLSISSKRLGLGNYKSVAHDNGNIFMSYKVWSTDLQEEVIVKRVFCTKSGDALGDGALYLLTVEKSDGTLVFQAGPGWQSGCSSFLVSNKTNFDTIRTEFNRFYAIGCYIWLQKFLSTYRVGNFDEETKKIHEPLFKSAINIVEKRLKDANVTDQEAVLLWKEFNHEIFQSIINEIDALGPDKSHVSLRDIMIKIEEDEIEMGRAMDTFIHHVVGQACSPLFLHQITYVNSSSAQVARLYSADDDNKMCNALRELNNRKMEYDDDYDAFYSDYTLLIHKPGSFLDRWLDKFKIGKSLDVKGTDEGLGIMVYLDKGEEKRLLADEGYGITQLVALLLQIENSIPIILNCDSETYINERKCIYNYEPKTICVEEPEIHLHPKYQSLLADMFVEAYQKYNIHFIIETHSEYLIRKLQVMVADRENALSPNDVSLNYVEKDENGVSTNRKIDILEDGRLSEPFGTGFFDEADNLAMDLMKFKVRRK